MPFTDVYSSPRDADFPTGRIYQHSFGRELFKENERVPYVEEALSGFHSQDYDFFISILWGDTAKGERNIDLACLPKGSAENWRTNFEPKNYVCTNGVWGVVPSVTCEEGWILLGREAENRRFTSCLEEFSMRALDLDLINELLRFKGGVTAKPTREELRYYRQEEGFGQSSLPQDVK